MKVSTKRYTMLLPKDHEHYAEHGNVPLGFINISGYGKCKVICDSLENTDIPHFHIIDSNNNTICCIDMYKPKYYRGHSKDKHIRLSKQECIDLNNIMNEQTFLGNESIWSFGTYVWEEFDNDTSKINDSNLQPDYTKLRNRKEN